MARDSLFESVEVLTAGQPRCPVGRNEERQQILQALRPTAGHGSMDDLWIHGPAGIGKTTCIRHAFDQLEAETSVQAAYINCWQYNTRPSLLTELLIQNINAYLPNWTSIRMSPLW